jgi:uncharacterized protein YqcC (DUF446 family)
MASTEDVARKIGEIESEMRRSGLWRAEAPPSERYAFTMPFAIDTMAFPEWLQFILIPRVRSLIAEGGAFPSGSRVATQAVREFDGQPEASDLLRLLDEFDALFNR